MKSLILIFSVLIFIDVNATWLTETCPPREDLPKCLCSSFGMHKIGLIITCFNLQHSSELENITEYLSEYNVKIFRVYDSVLMYPRNITEMIDNRSTFRHLNNTNSNSDVRFRMFSSLGHSLEEIDVTNTSGFSTWRWNPSDLTRLKLITVTLTDMENITEEFPSINSLTKFVLVFNARLSYLHRYAFRNLVNLKEFLLIKNNVDAIHRDLLPNPAMKLEKIYIMYNKIEIIPGDFFSNMPNLNIALMNGNNIKFLSPKIFQSLVPERNIYIDLRANNIVCCSNLEFLFKNNYNVTLDLICNHPEHLRGRTFQTLNLTDIHETNC